MSRTLHLLDEDRRDLVREALGPTRHEGYEEGSYEVDFFDEATVFVELDRKDLATVRALDRLLARVVERNAAAVEELTESDDPDDHLALAWAAIDPIRCEGYGEGDYSVEMLDGQILDFRATRRDAALLRRYDQLLLRLYSRNRRAVESVLARCEDGAG